LSHPFQLDRRLVPFDPRQVPQYRFDVLVLGAGAAGAPAALAAARGGSTVAVITKGDLGEGNTRWAKGGVATVLAPEDSFDAHVQDTLRVGCGLCDPGVVERAVRGGPAALERLLDLGAAFDRDANGEFVLSKEGGHSHPRIVHARGDATGVEIQSTLRGALELSPEVRTFTDHFAIDLLTDAEGRVCGVLCATDRGERVAFAARSVILATGGAGQLYRETTNPDIATGDGLAMAFRAGAVVRDLEFVQFHPTCLYIAGAARVLISEIVRGAGAVLRDRHGVRFMQAHHEAAELAPRDVVSRAVFQRMVSTGDTSVYLDLSELDHDPHLAFPAVSRICSFFGIDIAKDPVPVRPGAHYMVGGLAVDADGRTNVPGLFAVGECASTGLHGANRMGSNSLLEALVLGHDTGSAAAEEARGGDPVRPISDEGRLDSAPPAEVQVNLADLTYSLKSMMWRQMGVERDGPAMRDAMENLEFWSRAVEALPKNSPRAWELLNMLTVARLATLGALEREESRGVHHRTDFPALDPAGASHLELRPQGNARRLRAVDLVRTPARGVLPLA
tara:strand:- start:4026 stop:5711 length:1686 start_codon:yes stop_codon:yes gene_type:complete